MIDNWLVSMLELCMIIGMVIVGIVAFYAFYWFCWLVLSTGDKLIQYIRTLL